MTSSLLRRPSGLSQPNVTTTSGVISALGESVELATNGHDTVIFEVLSNGWVGTVQFQHFIEGSGWGALSTIGLINGAFPAGGNSTTSGRVATGFCGSATAVRVVSTAWTSGVAPVHIRVVKTSEGLLPVISVASVTTVGSSARGAAVTGNPVLQGIRAATASPTAVTDGQVIEPLSTVLGAQVTYPWSIPQATWSFASAAGGIINTADVALASAAGAGLRRYLTSLTLSNNSATGTDVQIKDGASTVLARFFLPGNAPNFHVSFECPLFTTANQALNIACGTTAAAVFANAQGFTAP